MATVGARYIIPRYSSRAGTFGQKLISGGTGRGEEGLAGRLSISPYQSLIAVAFKCWLNSLLPSPRSEMDWPWLDTWRYSCTYKENVSDRDGAEDRQCAHQCECVAGAGSVLYSNEVWFTFVGFVGPQKIRLIQCLSDCADSAKLISQDVWLHEMQNKLNDTCHSH